MTARKIDWTRELRTTDGHDAVTVERINPTAARPISIHVAATGWRGDVDRDGFGSRATTVPLVENVPAEPVIVERFMIVRKQSTQGCVGYFPEPEAILVSEKSALASKAKPSAFFDYLIARVLIEECG